MSEPPATAKPCTLQITGRLERNRLMNCSVLPHHEGVVLHRIPRHFLGVALAPSPGRNAVRS